MHADTVCRIEDIERIERVIAALRDPDCHRLSLLDMAEIACLSQFHFARVFRRVTGVPPGEFAVAVRMERAKHLLLTTSLSVTDICFEVGYAGLGAFVTSFTRLVGVSPGRYRQSDITGWPSVLLARTPVVMATMLATIEGEIHTPVGGVVSAFVGFFPAPIARGLPAAGLVLTAPSRFRLWAPCSGGGHLVAVGRREPVPAFRPRAYPSPPLQLN